MGVALGGGTLEFAWKILILFRQVPLPALPKKGSPKRNHIFSAAFFHGLCGFYGVDNMYMKKGSWRKLPQMAPSQPIFCESGKSTLLTSYLFHCSTKDSRSEFPHVRKNQNPTSLKTSMTNFATFFLAQWTEVVGPRGFRRGERFIRWSLVTPMGCAAATSTEKPVTNCALDQSEPWQRKNWWGNWRMNVPQMEGGCCYTSSIFFGLKNDGGVAWCSHILLLYVEVEHFIAKQVWNTFINLQINDV